MVEPHVPSYLAPSASFSETTRGMLAPLARIELNLEKFREVLERTHRELIAEMRGFDQRLSARILSSQIARLETFVGDDPAMRNDTRPDSADFRAAVGQLRADLDDRGDERDLTPLVTRLAALQAQSGIQFAAEFLAQGDQARR